MNMTEHHKLPKGINALFENAMKLEKKISRMGEYDSPASYQYLHEASVQLEEVLRVITSLGWDGAYDVFVLDNSTVRGFDNSKKIAELKEVVNQAFETYYSMKLNGFDHKDSLELFKDLGKMEVEEEEEDESFDWDEKIFELYHKYVLEALSYRKAKPSPSVFESYRESAVKRDEIYNVIKTLGLQDSLIEYEEENGIKQQLAEFSVEDANKFDKALEEYLDAVFASRTQIHHAFQNGYSAEEYVNTLVHAMEKVRNVPKLKQIKTVKLTDSKGASQKFYEGMTVTLKRDDSLKFATVSSILFKVQEEIVRVRGNVNYGNHSRDEILYDIPMKDFTVEIEYK